MSDFLKKAAGLFFNIEETEQAAEPESADEPSAPFTPAPATDNTSVEKFRKYFRELYERSNLSGPDFFEFYNMVEAMGSLIADEIKYPSVFAGFSGQLTREKLLASAGHYLSVLQQDRADFERSLDEARRLKVTGRKSEIEKKGEEIRRLQEQIAALNREIAELNGAVQQDEARLAAEQAAYFQQSDSFRLRIQTGIGRINQYIQ